MRWPSGSTSQPTITSPFGPREASGNASTYHRGADMVGFEIIRAVASGTVRCSGSAPAGWSNGGDQVWIQHDGFFSKSLHQARSLVSDGQWVNEGDAVGVMGSSGSAQGKHLHFEITPGELHFGNYGQVDPLAFLAARVDGGSNFPARDKYGAAHVEALQNELRAVGYDITVDGYDGAQTQAAVRDFQSKNGLDVDGIGGPDTRRALQAKATQNVGRNITSRPTSEVQQLVGANPDGIYGPDTTAKVADWQRAHGLEADGIWGPDSDAAGFPAKATLDVDGDLGPKTIKGLQLSLGFTGSDVDGDLGPKTVTALQIALGFTGGDVDGDLGEKTISALQAALGVHVDGDWGPQTTRALQSLLNAGGRVTPTPTPTPAPAPSPTPDASGSEADFTPAIVTPGTSHFPSWIRYEEALDPDGQKANLNKDAARYYGARYQPIESHTHWWNQPGQGGTHDGNVSHIRQTADLSVNYVVSQNRITLMVPLNKIALTTGARNPYAWKSENDPTLTEQQYKTMGYLHYIVEKLNPGLAGEPIRRHKEFMATSCSEIDTAKVRAYAQKFATGQLDPATGEPPAGANPTPTPTGTLVDPALLEEIKATSAKLASLVSELP